MSNLFIKRIVAYVSVFGMVVASIVPLVTSAAYAQGDLVKKASSSTVYWYGGDNKLFTFPSPVEYFSRYANFDTVKTVSDAEFAAFKLAGTVGVKSGTWMVKVPDFSQTYAIEPGAKIRWVQSEAVASSLFGSNWNQWIKDINPNTFAATYKEGSAISAANEFPTGHVIKVDGTKYVVDGNKIRAFASDSAFTANMFRSEFVHEVTASAVAAFSQGTSVTGLETALLDMPSESASVVVPVSGDITFSLSSETPASMSMPSGAANTTFTKVNVTNGANVAVNLTEVKVKRFGVSSDLVFDAVKVYDANMVRHGGSVNLNNSYATISFSNDPIVLAAGATTSINIAGDIEATKTSGTVGLMIESSSDVKVSGGSVKGSFPIRGNEMTLVDGSDLLGTLDIDVVGNHTQNYDIGATQEIVSEFKVNGVTNETVQVSRIVFTQRGTATASDLANVTLYNNADNTILGKAAGLNGDNQAIIDLNNLKIAEGKTVTMTLKADVKGGTARTVQFVVEEAEDIFVKGYETGVNFLTGGSFPVGDGISEHTINAGDLTLNKDNSSPSNKIAAGSEQIASIFSFEGSGEINSIREIYVAVSADQANPVLTTLRLVNPTTGSELASAKSNVTMGDSVALTDYNVYKFTLSPYLDIAPGESIKVAIQVQLDETSFSTGEQIRTAIAGFRFKKIQDSNTFDVQGYTSEALGDSEITNAGGAPIDDSFVVEANALAVEDSSLTISKDTSLGNQYLIAGSTEGVLGQFVVKAGQAEGVNVSNITIGTDSTLTTGNTFPTANTDTANAFSAGRLTNVKLYKWTGSVWQKISTTSNNPTSGPTFSVSGELNLAANQSVQVRLVAAVATSGVSDSTGNGGLMLTAFGSATGNPSNKSLDSGSAVVLQTMTVSASGGVLTPSIDNTEASASSILVANDSLAELTRVKFSASLVEGVKITRVKLEGLNIEGNLAKVYLYDGTTKVGEQSISNGEVIFSGLSVSVAKGSSKVLIVKADLTDIQTLKTNSTNTQYVSIRIKEIDAEGATSLLNIEPVLSSTYLAPTSSNGGSLTNNDFIYSSGAVAGVTSGAYGFYGDDGDDDLTDGTDTIGAGTATAVTGTAIVTWSSNYKVSTLVPAASVMYGDSNNNETNDDALVTFSVGDLVYVRDISLLPTIVEGFAVITTGVASGASVNGVAFTTVGSSNITSLDEDDMIVNISKQTNLPVRTMRVDDVELVATSTGANTTLSPQADQQIGSFTLTANGKRDLSISQLMVTVSGSNSPLTVANAGTCTQGAANAEAAISGCKVHGFTLKDSNGTPVAVSSVLTDTPSGVVTFVLSGTPSITQGSSKVYKVYADTSNVKMDGSGVPVNTNVTLTARLAGDQGPFATSTAPVSATYVSAFDGSTPVTVNKSDSYPVNGYTVTY